MAFQYKPAEFPQYEIEVYTAGSDTAKTFQVPQLGYVPKDVHEAADVAITERFLAVQKLRDERNKKRIAMPDSDKAVQYPTQLDVMDELLQRLEPELAELVAQWELKPREDLWLQWEKESKPADLGKSEASSDSSDATE